MNKDLYIERKLLEKRSQKRKKGVVGMRKVECPICGKKFEVIPNKNAWYYFFF